MELKAYGSLNKKQTVYLDLIERESHVCVRVVDAKGNWVPGGSLLTIKNDGTYQRASGVNPELGFQLENNGGIKES